MKFYTLLILILLGTNSCSKVLFQKPQAALPEKFKNSVSDLSNTSELSEKYWQTLNDSVLNGLIEETLKNNAQLKASAFRLERDFSLARTSLAQLFPQLYTSPSFQKIRVSENTGQPVGTFFPREHNLFSLPLNLEYEIDLWGRVRNLYKAKRKQAKAAYFLHQQTQKLLIAQTIKAYLLLQTLEQQSQRQQKIFEAQQNIYQLKQALFKSGLINEENLLRTGADAIVAKDDANLWQSRVKVQKNLLAILLGKSPSEFEIKLNSAQLTSPDTQLLPDQIPASWLQRRNDIQAAEQQVLASQALAKSALAEFFPKISFNLSYGIQAQNFSDLFKQSSTFFSLGPQISLPLFNTGKNYAEYKGRKNEILATLEDYRQTVLKALQETEDALILYVEKREKDQHGKILLKDAQKVFGQMQSKKRSGLISEIQLLVSNIETLKVENEKLERHFEFLQAWVNALEALGL